MNEYKLIKTTILIVLSLMIVFLSGCTKSEPSLRDKLRDIEEDLHSAQFHLEEARDFYDALEREFSATKSTEWEMEILENIKEYVTLMGWRAEDMDDMVKQAINELGNAQVALEDIIWDLQK